MQLIKELKNQIILSDRQIASLQEKTIILLLDKQLHCLPWESMKYIENVMITRIPSFQPFITNKHIQFNDDIPGFHFNPTKGYYILNPSNDLVKTEEKLMPLLKQTVWNGISNKPPEEQEFLNELEQ